MKAPEYQGRCTKRPLSHQFRQADRWALKCWFLRSEQRCYGKREAPVIVVTEERGTYTRILARGGYRANVTEDVQEPPGKSVSGAQYGKDPSLGCCTPLVAAHLVKVLHTSGSTCHAIRYAAETHRTHLQVSHVCYRLLIDANYPSPSRHPSFPASTLSCQLHEHPHMLQVYRVSQRFAAVL